MTDVKGCRRCSEWVMRLFFASGGGVGGGGVGGIVGSGGRGGHGGGCDFLLVRLCNSTRGPKCGCLWEIARRIHKNCHSTRFSYLLLVKLCLKT